MKRRREVLAAGAVGAVALTAGCIGFVRGEEALELSAEPAMPSEETVSATEFVEDAIDGEEIDETIELEGVEREVTASIWSASYERTVEIGGRETDGAFYASISIPSAEVLGYSINPLDHLDGEDLIGEFEDEFDDDDAEDAVSDMTHDGTRRVGVLGEERDIEVFVGESEVEGEDVELSILLGRVNHEGDLIILVGVYPSMFADVGVEIEDLMESTEHPVER